MRYMTNEELERSKMLMEKMDRKFGRKEKIGKGLLSALRTIIYTPLSIVFHIISFIARGIGCISSCGILAGFYYLYQSFHALSNGIPLKEIDTIGKAAAFIIFPFIAYGISVVTEHIYMYFEDNAF